MDYEIRKMWEAVLADLATQYGMDRADLRLRVKAEFMAEGLIKKSTNEFRSEELEHYAKKLIAVTMLNDQNPPEWKKTFNLRHFLFPKTNNNE